MLDTSFGAREEPLFVTISTQSNDPEHILSKLIDDGLAKTDPAIVCHLYAADEDCALDDEAQWLKANPALGVFRDREDLVAAVRKAMRMPAEEPKVRNLFLNQRVSPSSPLIARAEWFACAASGPVEFSEGEEVYLGLDLSSVLDLTALVMGSVDEPLRVQSWFWKPADLLREHSDRDFGAGNLRYVEWHDAGHLKVSPGKSIDPAVVALFIAELTRRYRIRGLAYDRWRIDELMREFDRLGLQTFKDGDKGDGLAARSLGPGLQGYGARDRRARAGDHRALARAPQQPAAELEYRQRDRHHRSRRQSEARQGQGAVPHRRRGGAGDAARLAGAGSRDQADRYRGADRISARVGSLERIMVATNEASTKYRRLPFCGPSRALPEREDPSSRDEPK